MKLVPAVDFDIVELVFSLEVDPILGLLELDLDVLTLIVIVALNTELMILYLMRERAVGLREVMMAE